jgi:ABC-2 type transport system permease protein
VLRKAFHIAILMLRQFAVPATLVYLLPMPLLFTFALGQASAGSEGGATAVSIPVAVINQDTGSLGEHLVDQIETVPNLAVQPMAEEVALAKVADADVAAALLIPADFSDELLAGETTTLQFRVANADEQTQLVEQVINTAAGRLVGSLQASGTAVRVAIALDVLDAGDSVGQRQYADEAFEIVEAGWKESLPIVLQVTQVTGFDEEREIPGGVDQSSPGMLVMFSMFAFLGGGVMLVTERQEGTLSRLITMPVGKVGIMLGKLAGIFVVGVGQIVLLIFGGIFLFRVSWGQSPIALILVVLSFALAMTSLGVLLAALARTTAQATALDNIIVLSFSALGGAWWPLEIVPGWLQTLAHVLPTAWAMDAFHDIITRGLGVAAVLPEVGVLLGLAAIFFTIGVWSFRYE